ncbi:bifunctional RNase H/acid phosphatase [Corynebacterium resistens]
MRLRLECDGGSRGNPGVAGAGSSIVDAASAVRGDKQELAAQWEHLAKATNNVAEYHGLVNGLKLAAEVASKKGEKPSDVELDVFMDSKLIVEQMSGRWKIKHPDMKPLAAKAQELGAVFAAVNYTWVPRAQNKRADELANRAMDDGEGGLWFDASLDQEKPKTTSTTAQSSWHGGARPARFLLLRHGQTQMSVDGQFSGLSDPELTGYGQWQADRAAEFIARRGEIATIVSSPLKRATQTADAVARALRMGDGAVEVEERLIEMDFGHWEGREFKEVRESHPEEHEACFSDPCQAPKGGESPEQVYRRVSELIDELAEKYQGRNVLLVSHVTPIKSVLRYAMCAGGEIYRTIHLDLASLSIAEFYPGGASLVRTVNNTHYLN